MKSPSAMADARARARTRVDLALSLSSLDYASDASDAPGPPAEDGGLGGGVVDSTASSLSSEIPFEFLGDQQDEILAPEKEDREQEGWYFSPTDQDLARFLLRKLDDQPLRTPMVYEANVYSQTPKQLLATYASWISKDRCYLLTERELTSTGEESRKRAKRVVADGLGSWRPGVGPVEIISDSGQRTGVEKRMLNYCVPDNSKPSSLKKTSWIMHEYCLVSPRTRMEKKEWALCKIYQNKKVNVVAEGVPSEREPDAAPEDVAATKPEP